jgi:hypothetical protein
LHVVAKAVCFEIRFAQNANWNLFRSSGYLAKRVSLPPRTIPDYPGFPGGDIVEVSTVPASQANAITFVGQVR